ncbi:MAG: JDVT-CTERM system CAAX-type protease [Rhodothermia bacterium]|nr:JDVT-CTERM system CAAX-type protease [Rhodothermia bacterium]
MPEQVSVRPLFRDPVFALAALAGPAVWFLLSLLYPTAADLSWPFAQPQKFLLAVVVYPVAEELVFRGLLQGSLLRTRWGRNKIGPLTIANIVTSIIFASAHLLRTVPAWAAMIIVPSLVFGFFRERHGVHAAISLHVLYNFGFVWLYWG